MSEKVLGFYEKETERVNNSATLDWIFFKVKRDKINEGYVILKNRLVPVVSVEWLGKYVSKKRKMLSERQPVDDFGKGEISGRIEALEVLLAEARKQAEKKGGEE